jgi:hypothetical protein
LLTALLFISHASLASLFIQHVYINSKTIIYLKLSMAC